MDLNRLRDSIRPEEGFRGQPYDDATGQRIRAHYGNVTIGYGRNTDANPITREEAEFLLSRDIERTIRGIDSALTWWRGLDDVRQNAMIEMAYHGGVDGLLGFRNMLDAIELGEWTRAAAECLDSDSGRRFPGRYTRLAVMLESGEWPGT